MRQVAVWKALGQFRSVVEARRLVTPPSPGPIHS